MNIIHGTVRAAEHWGWALAICIALFAVGLVYAKLPQAVGLPLPTEKTTKVVPALGQEGYTATAEFCNDKLTVVKPLVIPDVAGYEMTRTKDGKFESIAIVLNPQTGEPVYAKYSADGSDPQPAVVTGDLRKCLQEKAQ